MRAYLKNYRQSPRKVRRVANLVKGTSVPRALEILGTMPKRASLPLRKLVLSAVANAHDTTKADMTTLRIKEFRIDKGITLKRSLPRAQGRATPINKRSSNVTLILSVQEPKKDKVAPAKKSAPKAKKATK